MKTAIESYDNLVNYILKDIVPNNHSYSEVQSLYLNEIAHNTAIIADSLKLLVNYIIKDEDSK